MKRVCAWCGRVLDPGEPGDLVSHGICEPCGADVLADLEAEGVIPKEEPCTRT